MSLDDFSPLDSPLAERNTIPVDLPNLRASADRQPDRQADRSLAPTYHFCTRCWMPLAPVCRCRCAPEPYPEDATPARVVGEHPQLRTLAAAVAAGRYADDTATREDRWLAWLALLADRGQLDDWWHMEPTDAEEAQEDAR